MSASSLGACSPGVNSGKGCRPAADRRAAGILPAIGPCAGAGAATIKAGTGIAAGTGAEVGAGAMVVALARGPVTTPSDSSRAGSITKGGEGGVTAGTGDGLVENSIRLLRGEC